MSIRGFVDCKRGNVAMIFAVCLVPLLIGIGAAIDYSRLVDARERMQNALDAAVLSLSSEAAKLNATQLNTRAREIFNTNFPADTASNMAVAATYTQSNGAVIAASASGTVPMTFMNIIGVRSQTVSVESTAAWSSTRLRVALALDNTGSMAYSGKMTALKTATNNLINKLQAQSTTDGDIMISIVPFNKDVNIGTSRSTYVSWTKQGRLCTWNSRKGRYDCADGNLWPTGKAKSEWKGCVSDRDKTGNYDISASAPDTTKDATLYPAEDYADCAKPLTPMTNDWATLKSAVSAMTPVGATNQTIGLVWAWQSLKSAAPLNAPAKGANYAYQDVIILLSDGENTMNRFAGDGTSHSTDVDTRMSAVCAAAKADGVIVYTVLVIEGTESVLRSCASSSDNYFNASTASDIITSFGAIGDKLSALRISR